mmetsp:Transcript_9941/g.13989  ORF Transcript_9941/g.13989 Transcript_9941/m.13989 type:complete len:120 (+) Transcript_9941:63-422(+)
MRFATIIPDEMYTRVAMYIDPVATHVSRIYEWLSDNLSKFAPLDRLKALFALFILGCAMYAILTSRFFRGLGGMFMIVGVSGAVVDAYNVYKSRSPPDNEQFRDVLLPSLEEEGEVTFV